MDVLLTLMSVGLAFTAYQWYAWRRIAQKQQEFINDPNITARDKETEYKDSYEAMVNALDEERRQQLVALTEAFDYLNDNKPFGSHNEGLAQVRNVLLTAIQHSTYGR